MSGIKTRVALLSLSLLILYILITPWVETGLGFKVLLLILPLFYAIVLSADPHIVLNYATLPKKCCSKLPRRLDGNRAVILDCSRVQSMDWSYAEKLLCITSKKINILNATHHAWSVISTVVEETGFDTERIEFHWVK